MARAPAFAQQQALDCSAAWNSMPHEPRRKHASIVDNEQIAGTQMIGHPRERRVLDGTRLPREHQQSRLPSLDWRTLSDQLVRQIEVEIARSHRHGV